MFHPCEAHRRNTFACSNNTRLHVGLSLAGGTQSSARATDGKKQRGKRASRSGRSRSKTPRCIHWESSVRDWATLIASGCEQSAIYQMGRVHTCMDMGGGSQADRGRGGGANGYGSRESNTQTPAREQTRLKRRPNSVPRWLPPPSVAISTLPPL